MSSNRVSFESSYVLHSRAYRDSSRLLDVFSKQHGRVSLIAKGVRSQKSPTHGILQPFIPLALSWVGKGELQTLTHAETLKSDIRIVGQQVMCAYYINELVQRLLTQHDPHPELFEIYHQTLLRFGCEDEETVLRRFEKLLLQEIGYGLNLDFETESGVSIDAAEYYQYDMHRGICLSDKNNDDIYKVSGRALLDLAKDVYRDSSTKREAKKFMRYILNMHLGDKPLKTRALHWYKTL